MPMADRGPSELVTRGVEPEDEARVAGSERAEELRAVADGAAAGQQVMTEGELPPLPGREGSRDVPGRRRELLGQDPAVGGRLGRPGARMRPHAHRSLTPQPDSPAPPPQYP